MIKYTDVIKTLSIIPIIFFRKSNLLLPGIGTDLPIAELFLQNIFSGNPSRIDTNIVIVMFGLMEVIVFNILFGAYIYHDLYENSVYIFTRQTSRKKWFLQRSMELFFYSAVYTALFIGTTFFLCMFYSDHRIDLMAIHILVITYILILLFVFWTTLIINILAVYMGAAGSFIINYIGLLIFSVLAINHETIPIINRCPILLTLNPVTNVTIYWNDGIGGGLYPAIYFLVLIILSCLTGIIIITRIDISIENKEYSS